MPGFDPVFTEYNGLKCCECLVTFDWTSPTGTTNMCQRCAMERVDAIFAGDIPGHHFLLLPGDAVPCGLRADLPEKQRHHTRKSLGIDTRHVGSFGEFLDVEVFVCIDCGRDSMKSLHPKPKKAVPPPLDPEVKARRDALRRQLFDAGADADVRATALAEFDKQAKGA